MTSFAQTTPKGWEGPPRLRGASLSISPRDLTLLVEQLATDPPLLRQRGQQNGRAGTAARGHGPLIVVLVSAAIARVHGIHHHPRFLPRQDTRQRDEPHLRDAVARVGPAARDVLAGLRVAHEVAHQGLQAADAQVGRSERLHLGLRAAQAPGRARNVDHPRRRGGTQERQHPLRHLERAEEVGGDGDGRLVFEGRVPHFAVERWVVEANGRIVHEDVQLAKGLLHECTRGLDAAAVGQV